MGQAHYNGDADYAKIKNKDGSNIFPQSVDKNKWKVAMNAAKIAIDDAHAAGLKLYEWSGADPVTDEPVVDNFRQAYLNTRYMIVDNKAWSTEFIVPFTRKEGADGFQRHGVPHGLADRANNLGNPVGALSPTLTAVKIFYTANGVGPEVDPSFDWDNRMSIPANEETCILHLNREPRFYAAIGYDRGMYEFNGYGTEYKLKLKCGNGAENSSLTGGGDNPEPNGTIGPNRRGNDHLYSGYANKKLVRPDGQANASGWAYQDYMWPLLRLSDLYLMYIEACAEYNGSLDADAKKYLTAIHKRAGVPDTYHNATGSQLRTHIQRERMIELIFEGHWANDLRRWKIAEEWYKNDRDGMWGLNDMGQTEADFYKEVQCANQYFRFDNKYYFMPIKLNYLNINGNLVQNLGY